MTTRFRRLPPQEQSPSRTTGRGNLQGAVAALLLVVTLSGCAARGTPYPDVMAGATPPDGTTTRVVFLRPADRFDNYSASAAVIRIDEEEIARLRFGGFFYVDVPAGTFTIEASGRASWPGSCERLLHAIGGDTVYLDVGSRLRHALAGLAGSVAAANAVDAALPPPALERIVIDAAAVGVAAAVGGAVTSSLESAGRSCGGPYRVAAIPAAEARPRLQALAWSR